jgi:hypothetical protein
MRSLPGFLAAIVMLLSLPVTVLYQTFFGDEAAAVFHLALAVGFVTVSFSVFDFKLPRWVAWIACVSTSALAAIFLLQGVADLIEDDSLTYLANRVLGQQLEAWLGNLFIFWCIAVLLLDSRGKTRILGFGAMSIVVSMRVYDYVLRYLGSSLDEQLPILTVLYLLIFVWLLFESRKEASPNAKSEP